MSFRKKKSLEMMTAKMLKKLSLISGAESVREKCGTKLLVGKLLLKTELVETRRLLKKGVLKMGILPGKGKGRHRRH